MKKKVMISVKESSADFLGLIISQLDSSGVVKKTLEVQFDVFPKDLIGALRMGQTVCDKELEYTDKGYEVIVR